ncbi:MAG: Trp family transcriptional regulator [bacterium]|nr:Trp family transcriptional regulator [bacterium]
MKKYTTLSKETQHELLGEFCDALCAVNTTNEAVELLTDLLTPSETIMLAKRIRIAKLLLNGKDYDTIGESLRVSQSTIAKVAAWLAESGEGFRLVEKRAPKNPAKNTFLSHYEKSDWDKLKRRYPMMFWPQLIVEEIVKTANQKQAEKISNALKKLDQKSKIYKDISRMLKSRNSTTT